MPLKQVITKTVPITEDDFPTNLQEVIKFCTERLREIPPQYQAAAEMNWNLGSGDIILEFSYSRPMTKVEEENHIRAEERFAKAQQVSEINLLKRLLQKHPEVVKEGAK